MINYRFKKNVLLILPSPDSFRIEDITNLINEVRPNDHVIIWQPHEETDHRFSHYFENDYTLNPEHPKNYKEFEDTLTKNSIKCYLLVGSVYNETFSNYQKYPIKNFEILFWPTALLHYTYYGMVGIYGKTPKELFNSDRDIKKLYLNLNNKDRNHRCMFIDYLCKFELFEKGINTWRFENTTWPFEYFNLSKLKIDDYSEKKYVHEVYSENLLKMDNLIDTITETYPFNQKGREYIFHTEKTYRSILLGKPFIVLGAKNQNRSIHRLGFKLFDNIINYEFDEFESIRARCLGIIDNLYKLKDKNYNQIFEEVRDSVQSNIDIATNIVYYDDKIPDTLRSLIKDNMIEYRVLLRDFNDCFSGSFNLDLKWFLTDNIFKDIYS